MTLKQLLVDLHYYLEPLSRLKKSGAVVGKNVFWGKNILMELENADLLTIEDDAVISAGCQFVLHDSSLNNISGENILYGKIILKKNCYLGAGTILLPGTVVGENTLVGAGSLVKGELKADSVYLGRPAKYYCSNKELISSWQKKKKTKHPLIFFRA